MPFSSIKIIEDLSVVVQKSNYFKACRIKAGRNYTFGKRGEGQFTLNLDGAIGCPFGSCFRMERVSNKLFNIKVIEENVGSLGIVTSGGEDNRDLRDDGRSQKLTPEEISRLRSSGLTGKEVVQTITENSATFKDKTVYSQQKYVNKKHKKYDEIITIHKPSLRLLISMYYLQDPLKISNLRIDSLSQLLCHANVQAGGRFAVYESGTAGMVTSAMLHRMGDSGHLVHVYHGNHPQREAVDLMNFTTPELEVLSFINFTKLPEPGELESLENGSEMHHVNDVAEENNKLISSEDSQESQVKMEDSQEIKMEDSQQIKMEDSQQIKTEDSQQIKTEDSQQIKTELSDTEVFKNEGDHHEVIKQETQQFRPRVFVRKQIEDVQVSSSVLHGGVEGLVVACRQHPVNITTRLLNFLKPGHPFVVFSPYKEPLMELYFEVKSQNCTNLHLSETWLRHYQVLPQRTHPEVNMSGGGGYLLYGTRISKEK